MSYPFKPLSIRELKGETQTIRESNSTCDEIKTETNDTLPERNISTAGNNHNRLAYQLKRDRQK